MTDGRLLRGEATREKVLDAAERCFAATSFDAVSIRQIAAEARVTLGVVGFHAGSKQDLIRTVIARRVDVLNNARRAGLRAMKEAGAPDLHALMDAYISPYVELSSAGDRQWRAYGALIARMSNDNRFQKTVSALYDPVAGEYLDEMALLFPAASRRDLAGALTLTVASMLAIVASRARIAGLWGGRAEPSPASWRRFLVDFCAGGVEAALSAPPPPIIPRR
ncbi:MAG: TetR/AcrR family transcriptional regulator [Pikeienuella sp.]